MTDLKTSLHRIRKLAEKPYGYIETFLSETIDPEKRQMAEEWLFMFETIQALEDEVEPKSLGAELIADVLGPKEET